MEIKQPNYTAVLAGLTPDAYLMVVSVDPGVRKSTSEPNAGHILPLLAAGQKGLTLFTVVLQNLLASY